jgi:octaprenyl-diphosphate synthase
VVYSIIKSYIESINSVEVVTLFEKLPKGKGVRGKLINIIAQDKANNLGAIVEMIHLASLLHDDVIDSSSSRRGYPTINSIYGDKTAIMLGDILYSKAFNELGKMDNDIVDIISNSVVKLSVGELIDVDLGFNLDEDRYIDMIYKKTASLIEGSCAAAAIIANLDRDKLAIYGKNLGLAFQIIDDILDITSTDEVLGKPSMYDYYEGKVTLPYIYLYNATDEKERLKSLYRKKLDEDDTKWLKSEFENYKIVEKTKKFVDRLITDAIKSIDELPKDINQKLSNIIISLGNREF